MNKEREGELLLILHSFFESWFPIVSAFSIALIGAIYSYALSVFFAGVALGLIMIWRSKSHEILNSAVHRDLIGSTVLITLMFLLIFSGLKYTSSGNAAVIIFMQLFFSYLYFNLFGKEPFHFQQSLAALMMGIGALLLLVPKDMNLNRGDWLILCASSIAPVANFYQKRARTLISSETVLAFRSLTAFPVLLALAYFTEPLPNLDAIENVWPFVIINGLFLMGISKLMWIEAIHRISITKASAMIAFIPLFTIVFAYFTLAEIPTRVDIFAAILIVLGSYGITRKSKTILLKKN